MRCCSSRPL